MADSNITPTDGVSDYRVEFEGYDSLGGGHAEVRFRILRVIDGSEYPQATLTFPISAKKDGLNGMMARGFDDLISALRQMLYTADKMRAHYKIAAEKENRPDS